MISWKQQTTADSVASQTEKLRTPPAAGMEPASRLFFVDNLRVLLTILVVIHHLAITYGAIAIWYYVEPAQDAIIPLVTSLIVLFNQASS